MAAVVVAGALGALIRNEAFTICSALATTAVVLGVIMLLRRETEVAGSDPTEPVPDATQEHALR